MKPSIQLVAVSLCLMMFTSPALLAKRSAPKEVEAIVLGSVTFRAPADRMGCVVAYNARGEELWWRQIYVVVIDPELEKDVQDVFISSLQVKDGTLLITNERGDEYTLDVNSLRVEAKKGSLVIRKQVGR